MGLATAQNKQVSGTVVDEIGEPVIGASVIAKGTTTGTATDLDGKFSFSVPGNVSTLVVRYIGYVEAEASASTDVRIVLKADAKTLGEVVVTAMGITRDRKTLGYGVSSVKGDEIVNAKTVNPLQALQGKIAGLDIASAPNPGGTQNVAIRGYSSFGNNQPLYVVDGVPITNTQNRTGASELNPASGLNSQSDFGSGINALNPSDIEEITVLKGSAASALYGSRAAQGVIMITTKSGKNTKGKVQVNYDGGLTVQSIGRLPYEQTLFGQGWSGDRALDENGNWGAPFDGKDRTWGNIVGDEQLMIPNTYKKNRIRDFYDFGIGYNNSVSFTAGNENSTLRASVSQSHVDGPIPTDDDSYDRYTIGINASHKATNRLTVSTAFNFATERNEVAPTGQDNSIYRSLNEISTGLSIVDLKDINSKFNNLDNYFTPYGLNPYQVLEMREAVQNKQKFFGKLQLDWDIADHLKATYRFGGDYEAAKISQHFDAVTFTPGAPNAGSSNESPGSYSEQRVERIQANHDLILNYNNRFDDISVNAIAGVNTNERSFSSLLGEITSIYIPGFYHLSNSLSPATSSQSSDLYRLWGVYLNADLGYKDYLYLTLTARNDHSSTLPKDKNSYFYPGAMLSFIVTDFLKQQDISTGVLDFAKFRLAYGRTGKDADAYAVYDRLLSSTVQNPGYPSVDDLSFPLGGVNSFTLSNNAGNVNLKPELTDEFEVGAELQFFNNRIGLDISYYNKLTNGLIATKPMDPAAGYTSFLQANIGDVRNSGIELLFSLTPVKTRDFAWDIAYNFTKNNNKVERLDVPETFLGGYGGIGIYAVEGEAMGQFKAQKALTVDIDGVEHPVVDGSGNPQPTPDEVYLGKDINEKYRMGLTNTFTYKGISLSATLDFRYGGSIYCYTKDYMHWVGSGPETVYNDRNPFLVPNSVVDNGDGTYSENTTPVDPTAFHTFYSNGGFQYTDFAVIDRSFLKLRNVSLAYNLPASFCKKLGVNSIRASLNAENILLWTPVENQYIDPEMTSFGNDIEAKFGEFAVTPPYQTYVFGLSISF
jgi:TonB-linked SusC/RagA family outer membrane protein